MESCITEKTKAVVAVDYTGQSADLKALRKICDEHKLVLITDGAHSIGTFYDGKPTGSIADMTTFSFHPVKTVTAGEGGAVMTDSDELYKRLELFSKHGITRNPDWLENVPDGPWILRADRAGIQLPDDGYSGGPSYQASLTSWRCLRRVGKK